ncbi:MAG: metallophosphoesterase [Bacteroidales bacterium]
MFFIIVLLSLLLINLYPTIKIIETLPPLPLLKIGTILLFIILSSLFIYRMAKGDKFPLALSRPLSHITFTWIALLIYLSLYLLFIDLIKFGISHLTPLRVEALFGSIIFKRASLLFGLLVTSIILSIGSWNFKNPKVQRIKIESDKIEEGRAIKVALTSDLHLSSYIHYKELSRFVEMINREEPHLLLIAGDLIDRDIEPLHQANLSSLFSSIKSSWGVYAVSGNHEFYSGKREQIIEYFESCGVNFLIDSVVTVSDAITIVGREDRFNRERKTLSALLQNYRGGSSGLKEMPIIVMDHQLASTQEGVEQGVDLYLSGHTHNGQFWPGNLILKLINSFPYGYKKIDGTHFYVTSGLGLWGPKIRVGTQSELVILELIGGAK